MQPDDALARWGRHDPTCRAHPFSESEIESLMKLWESKPAPTRAYLATLDKTCVCGLAAEIARQAEWARLAEMVIELGKAGDGLSVNMPYINLGPAVALARRLRGEGK